MSGTIKYAGEELTTERQTALRGKEIALIPQSVNYLDPLMRVGKQVRNSVKNGDAVAAQRKVFKRYTLKQEVEKHVSISAFWRDGKKNAVIDCNGKRCKGYYCG